MIREIHVDKVTEAVAALCIGANVHLNADIEKAFKEGLAKEDDFLSRNVLEQLIENARIAREEGIPICQDTGMAVVFAEIGQDVHFTGGSFKEAVNRGVAKGYEEGFLRKSVVQDPINRVNTKDNTPAVVHVHLVPGDQVKLTVAPKGFGSENMSRLAMLKPSQGIEGVKAFILETIKLAGPNPCPPIVVGVGVGGTMDKCVLMAKEGLLRDLGTQHPDPFWADMEQTLLEEINALAIGPGGFGGKTTAMGVHIETYPTHIAGLPVAVNIGCHVTRHATAIL